MVLREYPIAGQLPPERTRPGYVFDQVGVDFAGPVYVRPGSSKHSKLVKTYICIFVSLTVKMVHIELISNQTVECFLAALKRFISR